MFMALPQEDSFIYSPRQNYRNNVGLIETTMNITRLCLFDKPEFLLFVGTAGSYGNHKIFDIVESKTAVKKRGTSRRCSLFLFLLSTCP